MTVVYEWDCETVADGDSAGYEDGEIIDHYHCRTYREAADRAATPAEDGCRHEVVLVRDDDEGRSWAYVTAGALPVYFTDGDGGDAARVPRRFVDEVARNT